MPFEQLDMIMRQRRPLLSVIILNWNGGKQLRDCIESVLKSDYAALELIVSDNGSTDGSDGFVKQRYPFIKLVRNGKNLGYSKGNNIAVCQANGDVIVFSNNDVTINTDTVAKLAEVFEDPTVGIATGAICHPNSLIVQNAGLWIHKSGHIIPNFVLVNASQFTQCRRKVIDVHAVQGAFLAIRKSLLDQIGLFDENFWAFYEDIDICARAKKVGYRVVVRLDSIIWHERSTSWKRSFRLQLKKAILREKSRFYFLIKYYGVTRFFLQSSWYELCFWMNQIAKLLSNRTETQKFKIIAFRTQANINHEISLHHLIVVTLVGKLMTILRLPKILKTFQKGEGVNIANSSPYGICSTKD